MMGARRRRSAGLNLLEMVFAATIFGIVGAALMGVWAMHARAVAHARGTLLATHLAEMKMEEAKARGWQVESRESSPMTALYTHSVVNGQPVEEVYNWKITVTRRYTDEGAQFKLIQVRVTWDEQDTKREVNIDTIIAWQS